MPFRLLRAGVFSGVCVAVSALLHLAAGGHVHSGLELSAATGALSGPAFLIAARQRGLAFILAACAVAQVLLHCLYNLHSLAPLTFHPGHAAPTPGMIPAVATSAVWLHRGEAALAAFCDLVYAASATLLRLTVLGGPLPAPRHAARRPWREIPDLRSAALAWTRPLRGPPEHAATAP
ncbi:hypothetical protein L0U85_08665 [Glycomyces sp. L485]|uniref:hypothetical protein n=1 Tax=Glycomyces sp. L485 TaxID=2909235 RepID=UPI001F4B23F2|nr:hypothetical protein [Glycomyces sp. L485]MCH7230920.1 hypothetical protein [Glycomyces sp. L485]